jgi:hypothetical protein
MKCMGSARSAVEAVGDGIEFVLTVDREVSALRQILPQQPVGVLAGGRALAVKRVTENKGKNTPGVEKIICKTPGAKTHGIASLKRRGYSALPLRRVMIPKKNGKLRPLGIPVMRCRAM